MTVVAPEAVPELRALPLAWLPRAYVASDLEGNFLAVAATSTPEVNRRVYADAEARCLLCNVVDVPELCSFILPAVYRRDPIAIAVSTGGASPALAQRLRRDLGERIGPEHVELARRLRALRPWAKEHLPSYEERRDYFADLVKEVLP